MAKEIASFADGTPMKDAVNKVDDQLSFISVFHNTSNVSAKNSFKYKNDVMAYCIEWESVVSTRVDKDVLDIKKLREMFNHYQDKVDSLRKKVNGQETKGKSINAALSEKLQRNEEKLDEASGLYEASARPLCVLIEEVVQYGYKDLYPFIVAIMKFEMERSQNESRALHLFQCEAFENELRIDLLGEAIKQARLDRKLTQEELGKLVGVQKAQISKLENSLTDARVETILKVFKALNAKICFSVEMEN